MIRLKTYYEFSTKLIYLMTWPPGEGGSGGPSAKERRRDVMDITPSYPLLSFIIIQIQKQPSDE